MMTIRLFTVLHFSVVFTYAMDYQQSAAATLWKERCNRNTHVLNDCNWCWCDRGTSFKCHARVCNMVDMFGHFNDAIREIDVGMEGKGAWRSTPSACSPGVYYKRESILCVCNEDGFWPNPVCRDIFRILHSVEVTRGIEMSQKCMPNKLYLVGCNVCFCPSTALLNPDFCTKMSCVEGDPVLNATKTQTNLQAEPEEADLEVYATCDIKKKYSMGCQTCSCLRNNRLLCGNCTTEKRNKSEQDLSICNNYDVDEVFNIDCNYCFCDEKSFLYCTAKNCLKNYPLDRIDLGKQFQYSETPVADHECIPATSYTKDCNTCHCSVQNGVTAYTCTLRDCAAKTTRVDLIQNDCVNGTVYEKNCLICRCDEENIRRETCIVDKRCSSADNTQVELSQGFCQPLRIYNTDCNICQCLASGQITKCTTRSCKKPDPITVDLVPVKAKHPEPCPKGMSYKLDCNLCFCLENGNAICTSNDCEKHRDGL